MFCPKKWINRPTKLNPNGNSSLYIQFTGKHKRIPKEKWLEVPEYNEEKELIYLINDWK